MDAIEFSRKYPTILEDYKINRETPYMESDITVDIEVKDNNRFITIPCMTDEQAESIMRWAAAEIICHAAVYQSYIHGNELAVWSSMGVRPELIIMDYADGSVVTKFSNGEYRFTSQYNEVVAEYNDAPTAARFIGYVTAISAICTKVL